MAKTYTLQSTAMHCGYRSSISSGYWNGFIGSDANGMHIGMYRNNYRMVNIMFDQSTLASLRTKTVTSIKLKLTFASSATIYSSSDTKWPIGYKLNSTATTSSSGDAWTRSDADSTEQSATTLGYIRSSGSQYTISANESITLDLTGTKVPVYGYVLGTYQGSGYEYEITDSATLTVVTNETDYTLKLSYNANGGSGSVAQQSATVTTTGTPSKTFTVNPSSTSVTKTGHTFLGWSTSSTATSASYQNGGSITISSNTTLYAVWKANTYTISYNKGSYGTGTNTTATKTYNVALTLKGAIFTRTGYEQNGWATSDGGSSVYALGGSYTANSAITLYPSWKATTSVISASNGTLGTEQMIGITRYNSSYKHTVTYKYGSATGTVGTNIDTSVSWTPQISLASEFPSATSGTCTLYCKTYDGSTLLGTTSTNITLSIPSTVKCTVSNVTLTETVASVASQFNAFVQTKSKIQVTGTTSTSNAYGATVSAYSISINGQTLTSNGATTGLIASYGTLSYSFKITDTRGRTDTYSGTYNVLEYSAPTISATVQRNSSTPSDIDISYSWNIASASSDNTKQIVIMYRISGGAWTTATTITPTLYSGDSTYTITGTDVDSTYDVQLQVTDYFTTVTASSSVSALGNRIFGISHADQTIARHGDSPADGWDHQYFKERFHDDVQLDGVVDVTNRKASASLSSAGWYRVCSYESGGSGSVTGGHGAVVRFEIQKHTSSENHGITMRMQTGSNIAWCDESSYSNAILIDKIRYTYNTSTYYGYVDIHYTGTVSRGVNVDFDVHEAGNNADNVVAYRSMWKSLGLAAVVDAPTGETIVSEHSFQSTGIAFGLPIVSAEISRGNLAETGTTLSHAPSAVSVAASTWTTVAQLTLPVGRWIVFANARFNSNATGYRDLILSATADDGQQIAYIFHDTRNAVNGNHTYCSISSYQTITEQTTRYLNAYQNSGSALNVIGRMYAIRIS